MLKNYLYLSGGEAISKVLTFAAIAHLARALGPAGYGYVEFAGAVLLCAGLIIELGFGPYGAREIAKAPDRTAALVAEVVGLRFLLAIVAFAAVLAFTVFFVHSAALAQLVLIYSLSLLPTPLLLQWVFQGHNQMKVVAALQVIRQAVYAVVIFAVLRRGAQLWPAAVAELASVAIVAACSVWLYRGRFGSLLSSKLRFSVRLLREGVPIGLSQMLWMVRMFGATVIVGLIASPQDTGYFGAAQRVLIALHAFVWLYYFNLLPSLSRAWHTGDGSFGVLILRSLRQVAWLSVTAGLLWILIAPTAVTGFYGPSFAPAGQVLQWLAGVAIAAGLSGHYRFGLIAAGQQSREMVVQALGTTCALIFVPVGYALSGPVGVAAALCGSEVVVWLTAWAVCHVHLGVQGHLRLLVRPALVALLTGVIVSLLPSSTLAVRMLVVLAGVVMLAWVSDNFLRTRARAYVAAGRIWLRSWWGRQVESAR